MFHNVHVRAIVHATEDEERVLDAIETVSGSRKVERTRTRGYHGNPILILTQEFKRKAEINELWKHLRPAIPDILMRLDERTSDDCILYVRFDKQEAAQGRLVVVEHDDVILLRAKVKAYPARKDIAIRVMREYLRGFL